MLVLPEKWRPQGVDDLEPRAWEALKETERSVCVTAGAGAGKTEFLAQKAAYLLQTGLCPQPRRILAISFKRDSAQSLAVRVSQRCSAEQARRFNSMTFDAFTKQLLDRFRLGIPYPHCPAADYKIIFPSTNDIKVFLNRNRSNVTASNFETAMACMKLPIKETVTNQELRDLLHKYWVEQYSRPNDTLLSFAMINRLVEYMLRVNPKIKRALLQTYPFIFLDEFQDTTYAQYNLVKTIFNSSDAVFTAVGDGKQKIMGWAGAMNGAFDEFISTFDADPHTLVSNWRSHEKLVAIQHVIAQRIDPTAEEAQARGELCVVGDTAAIWRFGTRKQEVTQISRWIRREVDKNRVKPHEIGILVRMLADCVESELGPAFEGQDLKLRNLARNVGKIAIQDLLSESLTEIIISVLRIGASTRDPNAWNVIQNRLQALSGINPEDGIAQRRLQHQIQDFSKELRAKMLKEEPGAKVADQLFMQALDFIGEERLRQANPEYRRDADFQRVTDGFQVLMRECVQKAASWTEALDRFEGKGQVPLMTIHKSKGLEFHTMIFFGFDARSCKNLASNHTEEINTFFVAFTRAMQRAFFSHCSERGTPIAWLENILLPAGVEEVEGSCILDADAQSS